MARGIPLAQHLLIPEQAAMSKTASDKNKKSDELLQNQSKQATNDPAASGVFFSRRGRSR
jgi:hypothetical protein